MIAFPVTKFPLLATIWLLPTPHLLVLVIVMDGVGVGVGATTTNDCAYTEEGASTNAFCNATPTMTSS